MIEVRFDELVAPAVFYCGGHSYIKWTPTKGLFYTGPRTAILICFLPDQLVELRLPKAILVVESGGSKDTHRRIKKFLDGRRGKGVPCVAS